MAYGKKKSRKKSGNPHNSSSGSSGGGGKSSGKSPIVPDGSIAGKKVTTPRTRRSKPKEHSS